MFKIRREVKSVIGNYFSYGTIIHKIIHEFPGSEYLVLAYQQKDRIKSMQSSITRKIYFDGLENGDYKDVPEEEVLQPELKAYKWPHNV